jgi:hypothetical protein
LLKSFPFFKQKQPPLSRRSACYQESGFYPVYAFFNKKFLCGMVF